MKEVLSKIMNIKSKKTVIALLVLSLAFVSGTLAYYRNTFALNNTFETSEFATSVSEAFVSPNGWQPGDTTNKSLTVTNDGDVDVKARVKIIETWKDKNNNVISNTLSNGESAAIINYHDTDKWIAKTCSGETYFVYTDTLETNDVTDSLIDSVTFNPNATGGFSCDRVVNNNGGSTVQCEETGADYDGATYSLSLEVETVQASAADTSWGTCTTNTYTVTFNGNGNDSGSTAVKTCTYGENCTLTTNGFVKDGYAFDGWSKTVDGDLAYLDGATVKNLAVSSNVTLYARWELPICQRATSLHTSGGKTFGNLGSGNTLVSGDAFDCDVNGDGQYNAETERFYYVSDLYDTSAKNFDDTIAVLIYYSNIGTNAVPTTSTTGVAYNSSGNNYQGPGSDILALLPSSGTNGSWKNITLQNDTRQILTESGTTSTTGGALPTAFSYAGKAARLLTTQELSKGCNDLIVGSEIGSEIKGELDVCSYLMEKTFYENSSYTHGYWLETPISSDDYNVRYVYGDFRLVSWDYALLDDGVRPVIEVPKSQIAK